jgi:hypothetical protein
MILCSIPGDSLHNIYVSNKHIKINIIKKKKIHKKRVAIYNPNTGQDGL